jgi:four helix bundle protein
MSEHLPKRHDPIKEKSFHMAVRIVNLCKFLRNEKKEFILSKQILRSGTNPGAMIREAKNSESDADFVHKLAIGQKETAETQYWLDLLYKTDYINEDQYNSITSDVTQVMKLIRSSILTKKRNMGK